MHAGLRLIWNILRLGGAGESICRKHGEATQQHRHLIKLYTSTERETVHVSTLQVRRLSRGGPVTCPKRPSPGRELKEFICWLGIHDLCTLPYTEAGKDIIIG